MELTEVYRNDDFQLTGISVSRTGRLFVNFPRWSDRYLDAVVEVLPDGETKPFPDKQWNRWNLKPATAGKQFVCVQSVVVDQADMLWIVDAAAPLLASVVPGGPKLLQVDLKSNAVRRVFTFDSAVVKSDSYLNDIRIDVARKTAYLTDSGAGGLVIVNLETGDAHRALDGHPSVLVEQGLQVVVDGKQLLQNGKPPQFNSDGIALSPDGAYLYYKAVTAEALYRIATELLRNPKAKPRDVEAGVEKVAQTFPTDGLWMDPGANLYLTDVTNIAVSRLGPDGNMQRIAVDDRLQWPDTFTQGPDGALYVSASHINHSPPYNQGKSTRTQPYAVFKGMP